ncbi:MAG: hypothetical protein VXW65_08315 [Pseudomonadota bacterium]|nr:hypothetical protein [Pseudomonadota bacterium]
MDQDNTRKPPFFITREEELQLRIAADRLPISPVIAPASSFDDFTRQLMIPSSVMELERKASSIHFSAWETESIRQSLHDGILKDILDEKAQKDPSHPPYIRVACTGKGDYDDWIISNNPELHHESNSQHAGDYGSPVVLEIWPAGHYSPIHSHGSTTGIVYCLTGQIELMAYADLAWDAEKLALVTLTTGQCAWLNDQNFAVHKVYCPMPEGNFAATFHVYLNQSELPLLKASGQSHTRDAFDFVEEDAPHDLSQFETYSDLSWTLLRREMSRIAAQMS